VLTLAAAQDYDRFYSEEIALRRALMFPPICDICVIGFACVREDLAIRASLRFSEMLTQAVKESGLKLPLRVLGPVAASYGRLNGKFRRRLLIKCKNTAEMRELIRGVLRQAYADKAFMHVSLFADMNGDCGV